MIDFNWLLKLSTCYVLPKSSYMERRIVDEFTCLISRNIPFEWSDKFVPLTLARGWNHSIDNNTHYNIKWREAVQVVILKIKYCGIGFEVKVHIKTRVAHWFELNNHNCVTTNCNSKGEKKKKKNFFLIRAMTVVANNSTIINNFIFSVFIASLMYLLYDCFLLIELWFNLSYVMTA